MSGCDAFSAVWDGEGFVLAIFEQSLLSKPINIELKSKSVYNKTVNSNSQLPIRNSQFFNQWGRPTH